LGYRDLALEHLEKLRDSTRGAGPNPGETPEQFRLRLRAVEERAENLGKEVRERQNHYESQAFNLPVYQRALAALGSGLARKALEILTRAPYEDIGVEGAKLQLELLLSTGHVGRVREILDRPIEGNLDRAGPGTYRWLRVRLAAATGDYAQADDDLRVMTPPVQLPPGVLGKESVPGREAVTLLAGKIILAGAPDTRMTAAHPFYIALTGALVAGLHRRAELLSLRGLLALERGEGKDAGRWFREALDDWRGAPGLARHYLDLLEASRR
jgi:hypothetical protein